MEEEDNIFLPLCKSVFAKVISLDMIEVKPLGPPSGVLNYVDYQYNGDADRGLLGEIYKKYEASNQGASTLSYEEFLEELCKGNEEFIRSIII
jgi:hypothetical protein